MTDYATRFAQLLSKAIRSIALNHAKHVSTVQDEIGYQLGKKGGASLEYWRKGHIPSKLADLDTLTRELVYRRGLRDVQELRHFLSYANHPHAHLLLEELTPHLAHSLESNALASQQTQLPSNPFVVGPPITQPRFFFGRRDELTRIFSLWQQPTLQNVALIGLKRSGKSSLLHYLKAINQALPESLRPGQHHSWLPRPERYRWVYVDFQDPRQSQRERLLRYILTELRFPAPPGCDLLRFMDLVADHLRQPTIILMDEIRDGLESPELDQSFWNGLRSLGANYTGGKLAFVLTAHESPAKLAQDQGKSSPFFNIFGHTIYLGPLTKPEAYELIDSSPQPFSAADATWIIEQSQGWPCLLQLLCHLRLAALLAGETDSQWQAEGLLQLESYRHLLAAGPKS